jgi:predicted transposase YbfD/YdcC
MARGADVLVQVKENQPELLAACQMLPQFHRPAQQHVDHDKGHGRVEMRTVQTFVPPAGWLPEDWQPLVKAVVKVTREVMHKRKGVAEISVETAWWVSTAHLEAGQFQTAIRGHWGIENQNHHVRDVVLFEDACRIREQPGILARLRSIALNCMRASKVSSVSRALYRNALNFDCAVTIAGGRT